MMSADLPFEILSSDYDLRLGPDDDTIIGFMPFW